MSNPSPIPFTPADPARLFDHLLDPHLSLHDLATRHNTTIQALSLFLARPEIHAQVEALDNFAATRTRLVADAQLPLVAGILTDVLRAYHNNDLAPPRSADPTEAQSTAITTPPTPDLTSLRGRSGSPATTQPAPTTDSPNHGSRPASHVAPSITPASDDSSPTHVSRPASHVSFPLTPHASRLTLLPFHIQRRLAANTALRAASALLALARFNPGPARQRAAAQTANPTLSAPAERTTAATGAASAPPEAPALADHSIPAALQSEGLHVSSRGLSESASATPGVTPQSHPRPEGVLENPALRTSTPAVASANAPTAHDVPPARADFITPHTPTDTASGAASHSPVHGACPLVGQGFSPGETPHQNSPSRFSGIPDVPASATRPTNAAQPPGPAHRPATDAAPAAPQLPDLAATLDSTLAALGFAPDPDAPEPTDEELDLIVDALESGDMSALPPRLAHIITASRNGTLTPDSLNTILTTTDSS
ncbi:hypothetical protein PHYC_01548 [Phycisphaerales bacterium]|nr:hypothetical protein PHYC_01548 [Phycisphaerales bacterium]